MSQIILDGKDSVRKIGETLKHLSVSKYMLVCDSSFPFLKIDDIIDSFGIPYVKFDGFTPNPLYEDVCKGVEKFNSEKCEAIVAIGGGSTLDVAKCIKLYCKMKPDKLYLEQEYCDTGIPIIAAPTTAGTGSESTRCAVIYYGGQKQSVAHESIVPNYAVLESSFLSTLPLYQKKCTMLDAFCQAIESMWSVNSTNESKEYSHNAIRLILRYCKEYLNDNTAKAAEKIMLAANYAGRAINITQTTAAHAMSYKLTSLYNLPHGHAVALCLPEVWSYMNDHTEKCIDPRGSEYLRAVFAEIFTLMALTSVEEAVEWLRSFLSELDILPPKAGERENELNILTASVNPVRLKNNPVELDSETLRNLYERILK